MYDLKINKKIDHVLYQLLLFLVSHFENVKLLSIPLFIVFVKKENG